MYILHILLHCFVCVVMVMVGTHGSGEDIFSVSLCIAAATANMAAAIMVGVNRKVT